MDCLEAHDFLMNTVVEQKIFKESSHEVYKKAVDEVKRLENMMSFFIDTSEVSQLNKLSGKGKVHISPEVMYVLKMAYKFSKMTQGAFDITLAPVIDLWRRSGQLSRIPDKRELSKLLKLVGYKQIKIDDANGMAGLARQGGAVDLGGIAKGYAADACIELYKSMNVKSAFVNFGGNVKTLGKKPDGNDWVIGIQHPHKQRGKKFGVVLVSNKSVVTSGAYERYFVVNGKRYHHILDCRTGWPSDSDLESVTVICENSTQADALSTAAFVMGLEKAMEIIDKFDETDAVLVTKDKKIYLTKGIKNNFYLTESSSEYSCYALA